MSVEGQEKGDSRPCMCSMMT